MKQTTSVAALIQGIEVVLTKYRASLAVEEIGHLESAKAFLQEIEGKNSVAKNKGLVFEVIVHLVKLLANPEVLHKLLDALHHLHQLL